MTPLEKTIGYTFKNQGLLEQALTHPSVLKADTKFEFERLEFLGDRVLGLVIATWIYELFPKEPEGEMAKRFVKLVRKEALVEVAKIISLENAMKMKKENSASQAKRLETLLADGCEALIGAMYLDGTLEACTAFIRKYWQDLIHVKEAPTIDPKSSLQEYVQAKGKPHPEYVVIETKGPSHAPTFVVEVRVDGFPPVQGTGSSKKLAEKEAAEAILMKISEHD